ncbi:MAG: hypothetical protein LBS74_09035 [Oscillospiraceae bacterium]|nr:hypothetical protein [Oscillospiraceae bacterium]
MKKAIALIFCVILISGVLAGCKKSATNEYPFTLGGVKFTEKPSRVVILSDSITEIVWYMQMNAAVIGRPEDCTVEKAKEKPSFGTQESPDTQKIISDRAELVICDSDLNDDARDALLRAGVKVLTLKPAINRATLKQLYANIGSVFYGLNTGKEWAESAVNQLLISMDDVERSYDTEEEVLPTVCMTFDTGMIKIATGDTMISMAINCAGGLNIAEDAEGYQFDTELLRTANPQFVLCPKGAGYTLRRNTDFQDLGAFVKGRVYELDYSLLTNQGDSLLKLTQRIGELIHPNFKAEGGSISSLANGEGAEE